LSGSNDGAASFNNDQATHLSFDGTPGTKDMLSLVFLLQSLLGMQNPLEEKHFPHFRYQNHGCILFFFLFLN